MTSLMDQFLHIIVRLTEDVHLVFKVFSSTLGITNSFVREFAARIPAKETDFYSLGWCSLIVVQVDRGLSNC